MNKSQIVSDLGSSLDNCKCEPLANIETSPSETSEAKSAEVMLPMKPAASAGIAPVSSDKTEGSSGSPNVNVKNEQRSALDSELKPDADKEHAEGGKKVAENANDSGIPASTIKSSPPADSKSAGNENKLEDVKVEKNPNVKASSINAKSQGGW